MTRSTYRILGLAVAVLFAAAALVQAEKIEPAQGWATADQLDKAIEFAQKTGRPLALLYTFENSDCPKCVGGSRQFMYSSSLKSHVRVLVYTNQAGPEFHRMAATIKEQDAFVPRLYLVDPDMQALGFVPYGKSELDVQKAAGTSAQIMAWKAKSAKAIEQADRTASAGRFSAALKAIDKIAEEDSKIAELIEGVATSPASKPAVAQATRPAPDKSPDKADAQAASDADADAKEPAAPLKSHYFAGLVDTKRAEYETMAAETFAKAKALYDEGKLPQAKAAMQTMVRDNADLDSGKKAADLLATINKQARG